MPLDNTMYRSLYDDIFYLYADWQLKFAWWPRRCDFTGKRIWLTKAYKGIATYTGPGIPIHEYRWAEKNEFLIAKLKGII